MKKDTVAVILAALMVVALIATIVVVNTLMFQHSIFLMFGADVHWFLDFLGACALNGLNLILFIVCIIAKAIGFETPFFDV